MDKEELPFWLGLIQKPPFFSDIVVEVIIKSVLGTILIILSLLGFSTIGDEDKERALFIAYSAIFLGLGFLCFYSLYKNYFGAPRRMWKRLHSNNSKERLNAVKELAEPGNWYKIIPLIHALGDEDHDVRSAARLAIHKTVGFEREKMPVDLPYRIEPVDSLIPQIKTIIRLRYENTLSKLIDLALTKLKIGPTQVTVRHHEHKADDCDFDYDITYVHDAIELDGINIFHGVGGHLVDDIYLRSNGKVTLGKSKYHPQGGRIVELVDKEADKLENWLRTKTIDALAFRIIVEELRQPKG